MDSNYRFVYHNLSNKLHTAEATADTTMVRQYSLKNRRMGLNQLLFHYRLNHCAGQVFLAEAADQRDNRTNEGDPGHGPLALHPRS